jgi:PEP-CTERM motif
MKVLSKVATTAAFLAFSMSPVNAAPIIYTTNILLGTSGSLTGTFTTDGTIGGLTASNFTAWNIVITGTDTLGHSVSEQLTNLNSSAFGGSSYGAGIVGSVTGLAATPSQLTFDFSNPAPSFLLFQKVFGSGTSFFCTATPNTDLCHEGFGLVPTNTDADGTFAGIGSTSIGQQLPSGVTVLAATAGPVPEPASWAMMVAGFGLTGAALRRRVRVVSSARIEFV